MTTNEKKLRSALRSFRRDERQLACFREDIRFLRDTLRDGSCYSFEWMREAYTLEERTKTDTVRKMTIMLEGIKDVLAVLQQQERELVVSHYVDGRTWAEVGAAMSMTPTSAQRIGSRALRQLAARVEFRKIPDE